jgi:hypothetical protein
MQMMFRKNYKFYYQDESGEVVEQIIAAGRRVTVYFPYFSHTCIRVKVHRYKGDELEFSMQEMDEYLEDYNNLRAKRFRVIASLN